MGRGVTITASEAKALLAQQKVAPSKYRAKPQLVDGILFASQREAARYGKLKQLSLTGDVRDLKLQEPYEIAINGIRCFKWLADFVYLDPNGSTIVEDVKGFATPVYRLKKRIIEAAFGIKIVEV